MTQDQLKAYCIQMVELQTKKDELEEQTTEVNKALDELRLRKIPELMVSMDLKTAKWAGIGRVQLANDVYAHTREGQKEAGIQWLRDCGYGGMIQESFNMSSAKALFRRLLVDGGEIPEDIFNVTPFMRASIVKN